VRRLPPPALILRILSRLGENHALYARVRNAIGSVPMERVANASLVR